MQEYSREELMQEEMRTEYRQAEIADILEWYIGNYSGTYTIEQFLADCDLEWNELTVDQKAMVRLHKCPW